MRPILPILVAMSIASAAACQKQKRSPPSSDVPSTPPQSTQLTLVGIRQILDGGGRLDWSSSNVIAIDRLGADDYFDVFTMNPDGTGQTCLTCGRPELPNRHMGNPAWHPSGDFIVFQVQKARAPVNAVSDYFANPGSGINNDIWITNRQATRFWQVTDVPLQDGGVLHPHFSARGDKLVWSERLSSRGGPIGEWALKVADVQIVEGAPRVTNVTQHQPGQQHRFYESHGFTPDGTKIIFSGNLEPGQNESGGDIYTLDLAAGGLANLTSTSTQWDEHAQIRPQGDWIVWMSSMGEGGVADPLRTITDYWIMRADGTSKRQLTFFNVPGRPESIPGGATAADSSWSPDGTRLVAYLILDASKGTARTVMLEFTEGGRTEVSSSLARETQAESRPPVSTDPGATPEPAPLAVFPSPAGDTASSEQHQPVGRARPIRLVITADSGRALAEWNATLDRLLLERHLERVAVSIDPLVPGRRHERLVQTHRGVSISGAVITRQLADSTPVSILGTLYAHVDVEASPSLTDAQVLERLLPQVPPALTEPGPPTLMLVPHHDGTMSIAYATRLVTADDVLVAVADAHSGALIARHSVVRRAMDLDDTALAGAAPLSPRTVDRAADSVERHARLTVFDLRRDHRLAFDVLGAAATPWLDSFAISAGSGADPSATTIEGHTRRALTFVQDRLGQHPFGERLPVHIVRPDVESPSARMPLFAGGVFYAGRGVLVFPDESTSPSRYAWALGYALADLQAGRPTSLTPPSFDDVVAAVVAEGAAAWAGRDGWQTFWTGPRDRALNAESVQIVSVFHAALGELGGSPARAKMERVFLRAFTFLLPAEATMPMAQAAILQSARDLCGTGSTIERALARWFQGSGVNPRWRSDAFSGEARLLLHH